MVLKVIQNWVSSNAGALDSKVKDVKSIEGDVTKSQSKAKLNSESNEKLMATFYLGKVKNNHKSNELGFEEKFKNYQTHLTNLSKFHIKNDQ